MEESRYQGSCLCGGVTYEIRSPFLFFHYCHCSRCRKSTGSAHAANIMLKVGQLTWTRGEELVRRFELPSAKYFNTGFCNTCGSSLPWLTRNGKYVIVPAGTLDVDPEATPARNIHWQSRAPWYTCVSELPFFDDEPS